METRFQSTRTTFHAGIGFRYIMCLMKQSELANSVLKKDVIAIHSEVKEWSRLQAIPMECFLDS